MTAYYPLFDDELKEGPPGIPGVGFKLTHDGNYDMENKILKNCQNPEDDGDVATKNYLEAELIRTVTEALESMKVELREEMAAKILETLGDLDQMYLRLRERKPIDAKGKRITNVADPTEDRNAVNKRYLENYVGNKLCYATTSLGYITFRPTTNANVVIFTKFSGDALSPECKFARNGFFRLGLYLDPQKTVDELIEVKLRINSMQYVYKIKVATEFVWFGEVKQDDQLKIFLRCDAEFTVQPFLKIEEIKWTLQLP